jgi:hypothetical protein
MQVKDIHLKSVNILRPNVAFLDHNSTFNREVVALPLKQDGFYQLDVDAYEAIIEEEVAAPFVSGSEALSRNGILLASSSYQKETGEYAVVMVVSRAAAKISPGTKLGQYLVFETKKTPPVVELDAEGNPIKRKPGRPFKNKDEPTT